MFSLGAVLLFPALAAWAGHYEVTYAGGSMTATHNGASPPINYSLQNDGTWGGSITSAFMVGFGQPGPQSDSAQCSGPITVTGTWRPDYAGELPPDQVIVTQTCNAGWSGSLINYTPTAAAANGLGTPLVVNADKSQGVSNGTTYQVMSGGSTVTFPCSPSASLSGTGTINPPRGGVGIVSVFYKAQITPVTISLTGTTPLPGSTPSIGVLIGQGLTAGFDAGGNQSSNWQWSASGDPFAGFIVTNTSGYALELTAAMKQQPSMNFYYRSLGGAGGSNMVSTVTCMATVTFPDGTQQQVTTSKQVYVYAPISINFTPLYGNTGIYGSAPNQSLMPLLAVTGREMQWTGTALTPAPFSAKQPRRVNS